MTSKLLQYLGLATIVAMPGATVVGFAFQKLNGTWQNVAEGLMLDDSAPVRLEQANEHLRVSTDDGTPVLRRERGL